MANRKLTAEQSGLILSILDEQGYLRASELLDVAADPSSPLHSLFEWDDSKAAHEFRLIQARTLIKRVNVTILADEDRIVHVPAYRSEGPEGTYQRASIVVQNVGEFQLAYDEALKRLDAAARAVETLNAVAQSRQDNGRRTRRRNWVPVVLEALQAARQAMAKVA